MEFPWGAKPESDAFFGRNPGFQYAFERLMTLGNKAFSRATSPRIVYKTLFSNLGESVIDPANLTLTLPVTLYPGFMG